jgi:hypothetical protein
MQEQNLGGFATFTYRVITFPCLLHQGSPRKALAVLERF